MKKTLRRYLLLILLLIPTGTLYAKTPPVWMARCYLAGENEGNLREALLLQSVHPLQLHRKQNGNAEVKCDSDEELVGILVRSDEIDASARLGYRAVGKDVLLDIGRVH